MAADGIAFGNRVDNFGNRKLYSKVVDQVLNSSTVYSRYVSQGKPFDGKVMDIVYDVLQDTSGQFFTGLETLNSTATNTTVTGSYAHTAFTQPIVSIMLESFANVASLERINLDVFKYEKAMSQALVALGSAIYGAGTGNQPDGFTNIIDDSTNVATIGGLSRSTYPVLEAVITAFTSNKINLNQMGTMYDNAMAPGLTLETPNVGYITSTIFSLYEQLLTPNVRASYQEVGYDRVPLRTKFGARNNLVLRNAAGFDALSYRSMWLMRDGQATPQTMWFANEEYIDWYGRTEVPEEYSDNIEKVNLGTTKTYEGTGAQALELPSQYHGWFHQKTLQIPEQAGKLGRVYCIGQMIGKSFRRHSKGTGITSV